jgi:hypothetical protein
MCNTLILRELFDGNREVLRLGILEGEGDGALHPMTMGAHLWDTAHICSM